MTKKCLVLGAGGFIGGHLVTRLKSMGHWVRGVDIKYHEHKKTDADEFIIADLRKYSSVDLVIDDTIDEVYQLAADMGGAEYIFSGLNDANVMHNSSIINLHVCDICSQKNIKKVFYSSSACMYPEHNQLDPDNPNCEESSAYPANPDSEYGWEKLFSERMYLAYHKNKGLNVRIARFHNIFGPYGTWKDGKEKAPAAICRKVAQAKNGGDIEIFGDGNQTRSFLYIEECLDGILKLMESDFTGPVNIGSDEMVTINQLCDIACDIANKQLYKKHIDGPLGVRGRNSDNRLIQEKLGWKPTIPLKTGLKELYLWIDGLIKCSCDEDSTCVEHRPDYNYDDPYFDKPKNIKTIKNYLDEYRKQRNFNPEIWLQNKMKKFNNYLKDNKLTGAILSVSGGIDSAVTLAILKKVLELENTNLKKIWAINQPIKSSDWALKRAQELCNILKIELIVIDQTENHINITDNINNKLNIKANVFSQGQLKSYMRTPINYYLAQLLSQQGYPAIVIGTGNMDEDGYLAYFCKAGDGVVDLQLIADLHKSEVFKLGEYLNIPKSILQANPSADLWPGQEDEKELGFTYDFVEFYTGYYLKMNVNQQAEFLNNLNEKSKDSFTKQKLLIEKIYNSNKHKLAGVINL